MWPEPGARDPDEMAAVDGAAVRINGKPNDAGGCLQIFELYETHSKFYMIGRNETRNLWRVLKIDRSEPSELNIHEDSTTYSEIECKELLNRIHEGNRSTGGLKFITNCYGIIGFVKFLGPYYMLLITERREIGAIFGHTVYAVAKSEIIALPNSTVQSNMANSKNEYRYKKLFCTVDLTKDFFFSYSYHIMQSLQKNICESQTGQMIYETMFIWNEFLTREIHNRLKSALWTVDLVYGFFKQVKLSICGEDFWLTLIARRSRHFAGTRYLKRGVNENGCVANDVETEQIIFKDIPGGIPKSVSSVIQNRGSIPLFWSQETSKLNLKPDIILKEDKTFEATRLHFENLAKRYGNPIIILNLIKSKEKKPRESILRAEFADAIDFINKSLSEDSRLKYLHWDLHKHSRSKAKNVLTLLGKVAARTVKLTGFFYCEMTPTSRNEGDLRWPNFVIDDGGDHSCNNHCSSSSNNTTDTDDVDILEDGSPEDNSDISGFDITKADDYSGEYCVVKSLRFQKGVLRTNCIDCLDRTNVAQYAYGLAALGHQLHALNLSPFPSIHLDAALADDLMSYYEIMGDTLSLQYGGSAAHNKIFSERRGHWKGTIQSQEFFRTLQRYYSNAYMDVEKQAAIDLFLGHFQPHLDKPAIWDLDSFHNYAVGKSSRAFVDANSRSFIKRSLSDGNILHESFIPLSCSSFGRKNVSSSTSSGRIHAQHAKRLSDSSLTPEISKCATTVSDERKTPMVSEEELFPDSESNNLYKDWQSNFLDLDSLLSSLSSLEEEEIDDSSMLLNPPYKGCPTKNSANGTTTEATPLFTENGFIVKGDNIMKKQQPYDTLQTTNTPIKVSDSFEQWINHGETLCH
ncbi:phosphoinositide phosphatase SAC3 isoform X1 [Canna indica]|uniref:Phosphoinositide phosphatase SAC3 isoform X1 n=1 Tax=Canna indica TaxID=4628 RepID=A0AAQ3Q2S3_9LILI|nr:phosphoinositide phosphatase SAC3 isoform X1 [Canna indica]